MVSSSEADVSVSDSWMRNCVEVEMVTFNVFDDQTLVDFRQIIKDDSWISGVDDFDLLFLELGAETVQHHFRPLAGPNLIPIFSGHLD